MVYVASEHHAYVLTKALGRKKVENHLNFLMNVGL